ncbi:Cobyric acid synthase OS=Tsukamurella paurometabola (strain ATCC 8368 / DSM / CCUG 35730 / CIP 100753 / JCM 10117 / KCTC 9821 / NBRC 16120 / NCIMB 702349/ NCTC 13040) OX=521096 GN=cobQ PE=3 SV=1 [Tsukamurella paurometabola]|uniref:Cobyric acid synthase n=1 Tax=Tsukamurella paurometabola (strain ATCC 8368 / DSM 20162 / CCUG 35730 / CIP 100753 / JCM 10117 / KCTC 9821 / NBRC 16120 / NCIMB 702349 / NCTC 13040) TaxID=521096 RepID=D5UM31_TSUPD|nr:cobyric acid synthase [Tsukamurella paurometabola]ADG78311.1 cobyric acid synthase CobQ [Tsukamurella paurometabola DSM 20162]SUP31160.1 Cobyric acid synthase [Tsukamurella paurometabola]
MHGALLIAGATSDAGKSTITAGLCRLLARRGVRVAPFKAQNMSNNSVATVETDGTSGEIGRAQATQALACGLAPSTRFNPVLLKPGSDRRSQLILHGRPVGDVGARDYITRRQWLLDEVTTTLQRLRDEFDVVLCEGAGSPAEINLRATDIANMGLARAAGLPTVVVGDIDRGGVLAHLAGTVAVLDPDDQRHIYAFLINRFRGDVSLLTPGLEQLEDITRRPTVGVLPYLTDLWLDAEDSLAALGSDLVGPGSRRPDPLRVAAIALPRVSNTTDVEALACEPGLTVRWTTRPADVAAADLVVLPGTKATVADLAWLRERGLADALVARAAGGRPIIGVCGGYQMLGRSIGDPHGIEAPVGSRVDGLGLLDLDIEFAADKCVRNVAGTGLGVRATGYEIHHGTVVRSTESHLLDGPDGAEGALAGPVLGTHWHGLLGSDEFRRAYLHRAFPGFDPGPVTSYDGARIAQLDRIADAIEEHCDVDAIVAPLQLSGVFSPILPRLRIVSD